MSIKNKIRHCLIPFQGTTSALKELEVKELFTEEKVGGPKVKGIEAKERTFIASQSERSMLESLSKSLLDTIGQFSHRRDLAVAYHYILSQTR